MKGKDHSVVTEMWAFYSSDVTDGQVGLPLLVRASWVESERVARSAVARGSTGMGQSLCGWPLKGLWSSVELGLGLPQGPVRAWLCARSCGDTGVASCRRSLVGPAFVASLLGSVGSRLHAGREGPLRGLRSKASSLARSAPHRAQGTRHPRRCQAPGRVPACAQLADVCRQVPTTYWMLRQETTSPVCELRPKCSGPEEELWRSYRRSRPLQRP